MFVGLSLNIQDHGIFLMDTALIPSEDADQSLICPSIFIYIICTNTHLEKVVSVSKMIPRAEKGQKGTRNVLISRSCCRFSSAHTVLLLSDYRI